MDAFDPEIRIDIRDRVRAHGARQVAIAWRSAPSQSAGAFSRAIAQHREPVTIFHGSDLRLFVQSFLIFFTATMMFLI